MEAKEKAKELVEKYSKAQIVKIKNDAWKLLFEAEEEVIVKHAKQCALIAVQELIEETNIYSYAAWLYWQDVKSEIEKM